MHTMRCTKHICYCPLYKSEEERVRRTAYKVAADSIDPAADGDHEFDDEVIPLAEKLIDNYYATVK